MIIAFLAETVKTYQERYLIFLERIDFCCTYCNCKCKRHAWRKRKARTKEAVIVLLVLRVICPRCHRTFTILPDFLKPCGRYIQNIREEAIVAQLAGIPAERATAYGPSAETVRRWLADFKAVREEATATLRSLLAQLGYFPPLGRSALFELLHWIVRSIPGLAYSNLLGLANILLSQTETPVRI